jgi:hypothetical protein
MVKVQMISEQDYTDEGVVVSGSFTGATSSTIVSPTGYEPILGHVKHSESVFNNTPKCWKSALDRTYLLGAGDDVILPELVVEMKVNLPNNTGDTVNRQILTIGDTSNGNGNDAGYFTLNGFGTSNPQRMSAYWGRSDSLTAGSFIQYQINNTGIIGTGWHKIRVECKKLVAGAFLPADMSVYIDDVYVAPDVTSGSSTGGWDQSIAHGISIGGNTSTYSMKTGSYGDILVSNDITDILSLNTPPTGSYNSITQR